MSEPLDLQDLSFTLVVRLRGDGHLCNVLTHVSRGNWRAVEQAIMSILRPHARAGGLNALARNIVELVCDGRGVTGPIMRAAFLATLTDAAGAKATKRIERKIARLRLGMTNQARAKAARAAAAADRNVPKVEPQPAASAEPRREAA